MRDLRRRDRARDGAGELISKVWQRYYDGPQQSPLATAVVSPEPDSLDGYVEICA